PRGRLTSIGELPKSTSGPTSPGGQLGRLFFASRQPPTEMSLEVPWLTHFTVPESRSIAMIASLVFLCGPLNMLPVPTYSMRRLRSIVGAVQTDAPDGPHATCPSGVFPRGV